MTSSWIPQPLRELVRQRASDRCEYCQTPTWLTGQPHEIDHILPRSEGGPTTSENLCLACGTCNGNKRTNTIGADPQTKQTVALFHPREQHWSEHFAWSEDGTNIIGLTPCGRATTEALQMNHRLIVAAREIWVSVGHHPPHD